MRAVNLLPRDERSRGGLRRADPALLVGAALAAVVAVALGAGVLTAHSRAAAARERLADAQAELAGLLARPATPKKPSEPVLPVRAVTREQQARLAAVSRALSSRIAWDRVLRELSLVVPSDITLSSLALSAPSSGAGGSASKGFSIDGLAYSHDSVARLLARLMLIPDLTNVTLASSTADLGTGRVTFHIDADVKGAPASAATTTPATAPPAASAPAASAPVATAPAASAVPAYGGGP